MLHIGIVEDEKTCQDQGVKRMDTRNIRFLESQGHNIIVHTPEGEYRFRQTMKEKNTVSVGGEQLQISRSRRKGLMEALTNYLGCRRYRNYLLWLRSGVHAWSSLSY